MYITAVIDDKIGGLNYLDPVVITFNYVDVCSASTLSSITVPNIQVDSSDLATEWLDFPTDSVATAQGIMQFCGWREAAAVDLVSGDPLPWLQVVEDSTPAWPGWNINIDRAGDASLIG